MKSIFAFLLRLSVCLFIFPQVQALTLNQIQQKIAKHPTLQADFVLQKQIPRLNIPFETSGNMIFDRQLGLFWQQTSPFSQIIKANRDRIKLSMGNAPAQVITRAEQPKIFQISQVIDDIFNGNLNKVNDNFTVIIPPSDENTWQLQLTPKSVSLNKKIEKITVTGDEFIQTVEVIEPTSGKTVVYFANHNTSPLTAEQQRLFD